MCTRRSQSTSPSNASQEVVLQWDSHLRVIKKQMLLNDRPTITTTTLAPSILIQKPQHSLSAIRDGLCAIEHQIQPFKWANELTFTYKHTLLSHLRKERIEAKQ